MHLHVNKGTIPIVSLVEGSGGPVAATPDINSQPLSAGMSYQIGMLASPSELMLLDLLGVKISLRQLHKSRPCWKTNTSHIVPQDRQERWPE